MSNMFLRARIRKRDKDIAQALDRLKLEEGEKADMIRDGFRRVLSEMGALKQTPPPSITRETANMVARELLKNLKEG